MKTPHKNKLPEFGKRVAKARKALGISQEELAKKVGISRSAVGFCEAGGLPSGNIIMKLADILGVSIDYLLKGENKTEKNDNRIIGNGFEIYMIPVCRPMLDPQGNFEPILQNGVPLKYPIDVRVIKSLGSKIEQIIIILSDGDDMAPVIRPGDLVLINLAEKKIISGAIYLLKICDILAFRRLEPLPDRKCRVMAENEKYKGYIENTASIDIIGRVTYIIQQLTYDRGFLRT